MAQILPQNALRNHTLHHTLRNDADSLLDSQHVAPRQVAENCIVDQWKMEDGNVSANDGANHDGANNVGTHGDAPIHDSVAHTVVADDSKIHNRQSRMPQDQNPELLHWRANVLLDEMMLGAIDIAAGESTPARALPSAQPVPTRRAAASEGPVPEVLAHDEHSGQTSSYPALRHHAQPNAHAPVVHRGEYSRREHGAGGNDDVTFTRSDIDSAADDGSSTYSGNVTQRTLSRTNQPQRNTPASNRDDSPRPGHGTEQWLFAAEQRYQQIAARQQANRPTTPAHEYDGWSMAPSDNPGGNYEQTYSQHNPIHNSVPDYPLGGATVQSSELTSGLDGVGAVAANGATTPNRASTKLGTGGRAVRKSLRSNLLPRMNSLDSQSIQQEISLLQDGIEATLPAAHETRVRAQHLLQKAYVILQEDATRTAEVDYYLQQVRTIVQRGQETAHWSNLYHSRLRLYLFGWLALSSIVILSRYVYAEPLSNWLAWLTASTVDSLLVYNVLTIAVAFFFGALGGGAGALVNMVQHARTYSGFFDRKYGLRGLILPVIGAICGLFLCVLFGLIYALWGIDPTMSIWFGLLPALIALALGASQEYFYGVRT